VGFLEWFSEDVMALDIIYNPLSLVIPCFEVIQKLIFAKPL